MEINKKKKNSFYDPVYVSKRDNITIEEAMEKIEKMKRNKSTSLSGFIHRHGEELGRLKFIEFQETSKHTLNKFISKYGEEIGKLKWEKYVKTKDSSSYNWAINKAKGDEIVAKMIHEQRLKDLSLKFDDEYFLKKYGEKAEEEKEKFLKSKDSSSYSWALNKADGDQDLADDIYHRRCSSKAVMFGKASKESSLIFEPIIDWLITEVGFELSDIFFGKKNSKEICIYDKEKKYRYYYDFYIKSLNLIIEYNGEKFHPNYSKYDIDYLKSTFKHPYAKDFNVESLIEKDKEKIEFAIRNGYDIHIIWSSDDFKIEKIKKIIKNKINYENQKNK
jgi:hypothetical protein